VPSPIPARTARSDDLDRIDFGRMMQKDHPAEALCVEQFRLLVELPNPRQVATNDPLVDDPSDPAGIPCEDDLRGQIEDDRDGRDSSGDRALQQCPSRFTLDVRGIHNGRLPVGKAACEIAVKAPEGRPARGLIRLVAGNQGSKSVGGQDLGRVEVARCERGLAGTGRADQDDEARVRDHDRCHEWVGVRLAYDAARRTS